MVDAAPGTGKRKMAQIQFAQLDRIIRASEAAEDDPYDVPLNLILHGPPGIGKTSFLNTHELLQPCREIGLATRMPEDIGGCPSIDRERKITEFFPMEWFAQFCNEDSRGCIFFDEFDKGTEEKQVAVMRVMSERSIDNYKLGRFVRVVIAANRKVDAAGAFNEMPKVVRNRATHFELAPSFDYWETKFATPRGVHPLIIMFISKHIDYLNKYNPKVDDYGFPTPRSWANSSKWMYAHQRKELTDRELQDCLLGTVGLDATSKIIAFQKYVFQIPPIDKLADGSADFPDESRPDLWVSLVARCIAHAEEGLLTGSEKHIRDVAKVMVRMPRMKDKLMLCGMLNGRPKTRDKWARPAVIGKETMQEVGTLLAKLRKHQKN